MNNNSEEKDLDFVEVIDQHQVSNNNINRKTDNNLEKDVTNKTDEGSSEHENVKDGCQIEEESKNLIGDTYSLNKVTSTKKKHSLAQQQLIQEMIPSEENDQEMREDVS